MASPELIKSWARTEAFLHEAIAALPTDVAEAFQLQIEQCKEFLAHNELGLAFETLLDITEEAHCVSPSFIRSLHLAAGSMGLEPQQKALAERLAST